MTQYQQRLLRVCLGLSILYCTPCTAVCEETYYLSAALLLSSSLGEVSNVQAILRSPYVDINTVDKNGNTPLIRAVINNQVPLAELLLRYPRINQFHRNNDNKTALDIALENNYMTMAAVLGCFVA